MDEKGYVSELINGKVVFGEKAARRIEQDYRMPKGHLDGPMYRYSFGERIRKRRKERGLSQQQLADYVGVTQRAVAAWENDIRTVGRGGHFMKLAEALGFDPEDLMADMTGAERTSDEVLLVATFRSLPKDRQLLALKLIEALK